MEKSKYSLGCSAKSSSKIEKSCHILPIVAWPWGGQSDLFRYYSSRDEVLLYESRERERESEEKRGKRGKRKKRKAERKTEKNKNKLEEGRSKIRGELYESSRWSPG